MEEVREVTQEDIKQAKREYMREYRKKNRDKFKNYQENWYAKRAAEKLGLRMPTNKNKVTEDIKQVEQKNVVNQRRERSKFQIDDTRL